MFIQQDVYANNLRQNLGYPLRCPNSESCSTEGLRIGDVGHVDESGTFHVLCNIRCPSRSDKFQAVSLDEDLICRKPTSVLRHSYFTGVKRDTNQKSGFYEFTATAEKGAILILPSGAKFCDLQDRQKLDEFRDLAIKHAHHWCRSADRNSLYLITGLYQTSSWTLASFYGRRDVDGEKIVVRKSVAEDDDFAAYNWTAEFPNLDPQSCLEGTKLENQTVLIKGFKMEVRTLGVTVVRRVQESPNLALLWEYLKCLASLLNNLILCLASLPDYLIYLVSLLWYPKALTSRFEVIIPAIANIKPCPELSREPHHLDIVNNYLLENSEADVVITHDNLWIELLEKSKSMVIQENELLDYVRGQYDRCSGRNAIWLQHRLRDPNGVLVPKTKISESRVVITHMCAENVTVRLAHIPVGFFVRVEIDDGICWWTENKPVLVDDHSIQWNDRIYLPSAPSTKVRLVLCASFEFSPMLGNGEPLGTLEICVSDLLEQTRPFRIKESIPLLVSAQRWYGNYWMSSHVDDSDRKERSTLPDIINLTDEGHRALSYYRNYNEKDLESFITPFTQALKKCPENDPCYVVALFNLAKAQFLSDQFHRTHQNFHDSISQFVEALRLRAGDHRDRPMTLLYLTQALLYYRASGLQVSDSTLHNYINELETICPRSTHARRAADLVVQTYELDGLQISDDWRKLDELIPKWVRAANEVPEGYFDKPIRFDNIGLALHRRFQLCHDATGLEKAVEWFEKAVQITPDGHAHKCTYEDHLSDARLYQWAMVVLASCSASEALDAAAEFNVPKSHVYWGICDILEGSDRVPEAVECFHKMQDELLEMPTPSERAWDVDFRRRCVKKLEKQGDNLMESRNPNAAIECYSLSLSLSPTNIIDIIVKCCKARLLLISAHKFRVYRALCDDLEGSDRVPESVTCFRQMQKELLEIDCPHSRAEWELDFSRRCVEKLEEEGGILMEVGYYNIVVECYSIALSLDPINISDIIVKCCKTRASLLEEQRLINANKALPTNPSTSQEIDNSEFYVSAIEIILAADSVRSMRSIRLCKNDQSLRDTERGLRPGNSHREEFDPPVSVSLRDQISASLNYSTRYSKRAEISIDISLHDNECMREETGVRLYRRKKQNMKAVVTVHQQIPSLVATTIEVIEACPRFQLFVMGNTGVGKSTLIHKVFDVKRVETATNIRGKAEIDREFTSPTDDRFVVHDSLGFEAGDEDHMRIVKEFVAKRMGMSQIRDRLHAIWLCLEIPYAGGRLLETGMENLLRRRKEVFGDIPLVVVLTKVDLLDGQLETELPKNETLKHYRSRYMKEHCIKPLQNAAGPDITHIAVSRVEDYAESLRELLRATMDKMTEYHVHEGPSAVAVVSQRISIQEKINLSIRMGKKKYWRTLRESAVFRGRTMKECLQVIHEEIVAIWNFNDPNKYLIKDEFIDILYTDILAGLKQSFTTPSTNSSRNFSKQLRELLTEEKDVHIVTRFMVRLVTAIPNRSYRVYGEAKEDAKILTAYIVDLICVMQVIFLLVPGDGVTLQTIAQALMAYESTRKSVHQSVATLDENMGMHLAGSDYILEKIEEILRAHSIGDAEINELRHKIP